MKQIHLKSPPNPFLKQMGLSLIELLISMLIAAFIFSGVLSVMQSSRATHVIEQETGILQESQRFASSLLTRDIRLSGSFGCGTIERSKVVNAVDADEVLHKGIVDTSALVGYEGSVDLDDFPAAFKDNATEGTDAIILRYADPDTAVSIFAHNESGAVLDIYGRHRFDDYELLMIVDSSCRHMGIFQITPGGAGKIRHKTAEDPDGSPGNCTKVLYADNNLTCSSPSCNNNNCDGNPRSPYRAGSEVMSFKANAYYIGPSSVVPGMPALKRQVVSEFSTRAEEIAQGVESMELVYGVDADVPMDGDIDRFVDADEVVDWDTVLAVRFDLVIRSQAEMFDTDQSVTINGVTYTDRFVHQLVSSTVQIRNRGL